MSTRETIRRLVERKYGKARRLGVTDRGVVSEENRAAIRQRPGRYRVGTPRSPVKPFEAEWLQDDGSPVRSEVEVKQVATPPGRGNVHSVSHP